MWLICSLEPFEEYTRDSEGHIPFQTCLSFVLSQGAVGGREAGLAFYGELGYLCYLVFLVGGLEKGHATSAASDLGALAVVLQCTHHAPHLAVPSRDLSWDPACLSQCPQKDTCPLACRSLTAAPCGVI